MGEGEGGEEESVGEETGEETERRRGRKRRFWKGGGRGAPRGVRKRQVEGGGKDWERTGSRRYGFLDLRICTMCSNHVVGGGAGGGKDWRGELGGGLGEGGPKKGWASFDLTYLMPMTS